VARRVLRRRHDLGQPLGRHGLQHVVHRAFLEGGDGVFVVRRDEHDMRARADRTGDVETALHRHADVEERDIGPCGFDQLERLRAVLRFADEIEVRPGVREARLELRAQHRLVFGDDGGGQGLNAPRMEGAAWRAYRAARRPRV
jgi:hypothetical protein